MTARANGNRVEYLQFTDEGYGIRKRRNQIYLGLRVADFIGRELLDTRSIAGIRGQHKPIEKSYNGPRQEGVAAQVKEVIREAGLLVWSKWGALGAGKNRSVTLARGFVANEPMLAMLA